MSTAAADGEALTLRTNEPCPGSTTGGEYYVATRGAGGWIPEDIMPVESYDGILCQEDTSRTRTRISSPRTWSRLVEGHAPRNGTSQKTRKRATQKAVRS